eukprot:757084-Hanusia_phi.AAC.2
MTFFSSRLSYRESGSATFIKLHLMNKVHINMYSRDERSPATFELLYFFRIGMYRLRLVRVQLDRVGVHRPTHPAD